MSKYRIVRIKDRHYIQKRGFLGRWTNLDWFKEVQDAKSYMDFKMFNENPNFLPQDSHIVLEADSNGKV